MCDLKIYYIMLIYYFHDLKDYFKSRKDYISFTLKIDRQTFKVINMLIKYFEFHPKSRKGIIIDELIELQECFIDIQNDEISRYKLYRFNRAYNHILGHKSLCGEDMINPVVIGCCYNVLNAIYANRNILIDYNYLGYQELGDLLKEERSKTYKILRRNKK